MRGAILVFAGILVFLAVSITSCGSKGSELVGQWHYQWPGVQTGNDNPLLTAAVAMLDIEFFKDGTLSRAGMGGKYSILDDGRLKMVMDNGNGVQVWSYSVTGDTLTLTNDLGYKSTYVRKKR